MSPYKQCLVKCLFRRKLKIPANFEPVFDADPTKELINCNLRVLNLIINLLIWMNQQKNFKNFSLEKFPTNVKTDVS